MPVGRIIVPVAGARLLESKLDYALALARHFGSRIDVLFVHGAVDPQVVENNPPLDVAWGIAEIEWSRETTALLDVRAHLDVWLRTSGISHARAAEHLTGTSLEFLELRGDDPNLLGHHARTSDLIVIGQPGPGRAPTEPAINKLSVVDSGRAVLIVPNAAPPAANMLTRVLIAWDGGLRVSRSVALGMSILSLSERITIFTACEPDKVWTRQHLMLEYFARNGITAHSRGEDHDPKHIGGVLVDSAERWGVSLICMGAYERARTAELIIGGNTWHVYANSKVPVLLAH
jgi:nucleotide-binding universal stress UspA family protein